MESTRSVEQLVVEEPSRRGSHGFWARRSLLEKGLMITSGVALLACVALVGVVASSSNAPTSFPPQVHHAAPSVKHQRVTHKQNHHKQPEKKISQQPSKVPDPPKRNLAGLPTYEGKGKNGERYEICNTEECILAAASIIEAMDDTTNPCDDFYQFACGGWMESNPVPESSSRWSQFDVLDKKLSNALSTILNSPQSVDDPAPINKVKILYNACMNQTQLEVLGVTPLTDFLAQYGGWPMALEGWADTDFDWQTSVAEARRAMGRDYLVSVWVFADQKDTYSTTVYIDQTSLGMPRSVLTNPGNYEERITAYKTYMASTASIIASSLGQNVDEAAINAEVDATVNFEMALAAITTPAEGRRDTGRMYNPMTVSELGDLTAGSSTDWVQLLSSMFSTAGVTIDGTTRVIVQEVEYIKNLTALIDATDPRTLANYMMWRHVKTLGDETNAAMREASFQYNMVVSGISAPTPRADICANTANNNMGKALGIKYIESYFSQQAKDEANVMVEDIRTAFKDLLAVNEWMDAETKPKAVEKADAISKFIGYPDWYGNNTALDHYYSGLGDLLEDTHFQNIAAVRLWISTDELDDYGVPSERSRWYSPPTIVNAFYMPEYNSITFPAGILQPPFYRANSLQALNYGGIGQVIGHEITHGFDDQGRQNDKDGNIFPWWSNATLEAFKEKAQCIVNQYGNISVPDVGDLMPNATLNGVNTQGENIADNGGLRQAFLAYLKYIDRNGEEPRLPGIDYFNPLQLFFLSNANIWCGTITQEGLVNQILTDPHSPGKYRVLVPMINMAEFSTVWNCSSTAPMNPPDKCVVW